MRLILATDGSETAEYAAEFLTRLRLGPKDEIIVLHVISQIPYDDDYHAQIMQAIKRVSPKILKSAVNILQPLKAAVTSVEEHGYPDDRIIEKAIDTDSDLIVMGASGVKGIQKLFLGSSTRSVAIKSPVSVLVVKRPKRHVTGPIKILFATDGSESAGLAGSFLSTIPFPEDTELTILNIAWTPVSEIPETLVMEINERMKAEAARVRTEIMKDSEKIIDNARTSMRKCFRKINVLSKFGEPSVEILNAEHSLTVDIIVIGCRGLRGLKGMMGSVSRRVLGHSENSVLIGKSCGLRGN